MRRLPTQRSKAALKTLLISVGFHDARQRLSSVDLEQWAVVMILKKHYLKKHARCRQCPTTGRAVKAAQPSMAGLKAQAG
ncbi:hypothetical protein U27_04163 [Candidatus Vecturithrix granuli]|uniref:Uncharacterized protein n=1 Tax=Vecturithrix granuli TaxID=1499967 RepID=A0A081BXZ3_VECG1|nr:hypothetical protein U27_04163 [Candidatus Vecturithrix granuli]